MFVFYTLLYIILTYLSYSFTIFGISSVFSLIRESYFLYLILLCFYKIFIVNKFCVKKHSYSLLLIICIILALPYIFISNFFKEAVVTFILYFSGPILFILISCLDFHQKSRDRFEFYFFLVLGIVCIINILFYFIQDKVVYLIPQDFLLYFSRGNGRIRYLGISFHPTTTGFFFIYLIGYLFIYKRNYIFSCINGIFYIFSGTRSAILGIPFYIFFKLKKAFKIIAFIIGIVLLICLYYLLFSAKIEQYLDVSASAHFSHLLVLGPKTIVKYPFGAGLGTVSPYNTTDSIIHLESEMYLYMIQLGMIPFAIKMFFYGFVIKKLLLVNTRKANWLLFILLTFMIGCMVFALNDSRFISNFIWIMLGIEFSKPEYKNLPIRKRNFRFLKSAIKIGN